MDWMDGRWKMLTLPTMLEKKKITRIPLYLSSNVTYCSTDIARQDFTVHDLTTME
jgi:hypothetical protein